MPRRVIVAGPPCAGKSTYVREQAVEGALILDRDEMARALGSTGWDHPRDVLDRAEQTMQAALADLPTDRDVWVIRSLPDAVIRDALAEKLSAEVIVLDLPAQEAKARAQTDGRPDWTADAIDRWWSRYQPTELPHSVGHADGRRSTSGLEETPMADAAKTSQEAAENFEPITTQEELDRRIGPRLQREREKFSDYDDLKARAERADQSQADRQDQIDQATQRAETAEASVPGKVTDALRGHLVTLHAISDEDADLFLTADDPDTLLKQVERLVERDGASRKKGVVPTQGTGSGSADVSSYDTGRERALARQIKITTP